MDAGGSSGIDLNIPLDAFDGLGGSGTANAATSTVHEGEAGEATGQTLSSAESGSDGEVQSTPEGFVPKTPYIGMIFDSPEAALLHYNRYAKHVGFSVKMSSSRRAVGDNQKDKALYICNKAGKNAESAGEAQPQKMRNWTITVLTDYKAKMRVKRMGANWHVT